MMMGTTVRNVLVLDERSRGGPALLLIAATLSFNFALCFVNTNIASVSNLHVIGCELVILALAFYVGRSEWTVTGTCFLALLSLYVTFLALVRGVGSLSGADVKAVRDFIIPVAFFWLGKTISIKQADRIVLWAVSAVLCIGLFEYFFLDLFLKYFNVIGFYIARGTTGDTEAARLSSAGLMVSGIRPESQGRELLPWLLGPHRVSSVFLEPSSLGNFGIIVVLWAVLRSRMDGTVWLGLFVLGLICIVLADTRFAAIFLALGIMMALLPPGIGNPLAAAMPFVAVMFLLVIVTPDDLSANNVQGRLAYSSYVLSGFSFLNWNGLAESSQQTFDAGYGYLFSKIGVLGVLTLWFCVMSLSGRSVLFDVFRNSVGAYLATLFLISQSQMTIKTAGLLWLLLGAVSVFENGEQEHEEQLGWQGAYPGG
jgi:putative polymerase